MVLVNVPELYIYVTFIFSILVNAVPSLAITLTNMTSLNAFVIPNNLGVYDIIYT